MPRAKNDVETVMVTVSVTPQVHQALVEFTKTGYFGKNAAETAGEMIRRGLESASAGDGLAASVLRKKGAKR